MFLRNDYFEYTPSIRPNSNIYEETYIRAKQLYDLNPGKITLSMSSGLDSQTMLLAFLDQDLDVECAFMHLPGYNDNEYTQLKILENKFNFKSQIVTIDPIASRSEIEHSANLLDVHCVAALHTKFLSQLPTDRLFVQHLHDHFIYCRNGKVPYFVDGYYTPANARLRAFKSLNRPGGEISFTNTSEYLYSIIGDDIYRAAIISAEYFDNNGLKVDGKKWLKTVDRWDYYIKPIMFGKYWKNRLVYFPKFAGSENVDYLCTNPMFLQKMIAIPYFEFLDLLQTTNNTIQIKFNTLPDDIAATFKAYEPNIQ